MRPPLYAASLLVLAPQGPSLVAEFPNGKIEARGACEIRPDAVACWDMDGKRSDELVDSVRTALNGNGQEVQFRYGRKNRYLVVRRPQSLGAGYRISATDSVYGNFSLGGEPTTEFLRVSLAPSETSVVLHAQTTVQSDKDVDLPLRAGSRATVEGWDVEVGEAQKVVAKKGEAPNPRRSYGYGTPSPGTDFWTVVMGLKRSDDPNQSGPNQDVQNQYVQWGYTPLDASGASIRYVDADGKPLSALKALALEPTLQSGNGGYYPNGEAPPAQKPKAAVAYFQGGGPSPAFRANTNIDPKTIATLRIRASHVETRDLGPFPLDPK